MKQQQTILMVLSTMIKILVLYRLTTMPEHIILNIFFSLILLTAVYILFNQLIFNKSNILRISFCELIAFILLADILYFKYFHVFPSIYDVSMIKALPSVGDSVRALWNPLYLLFFIDIPIFFLKKFSSSSKLKLKFIVLITLTLLFISLYGINGMSSMSCYNKFGIIHYHIRHTIEQVESSNRISNLLGSEEIIKETTNDNVANKKYRGIAKGRNVIVIQVEALQNFVINRSYNGQEITPNLNKLINNNSVYFNRYYQQLGKGGTSDAEFSTLNSLYPSAKLPSYTRYINNDFRGLPVIAKENGYSSYVFHAYKPDFWNRDKMYPVLGFERFFSMNDFNIDESIGMGLSDKSFFRQSLKKLNESNKPFFAFLITLTSHFPYPMPPEQVHIELEKKHENTMFGRYIQAINYTDQAIEGFINDLKSSGLYDDSVIAIYGDHHALNCEDEANNLFMSEYLGHNYDYDEMLNVPLIIHVPGSNINGMDSIIGGQVDFAPTMLNIMGIEAENTYFCGKDLNNSEEGFAILGFPLAEGSYVDDDGFFIMSQDSSLEEKAAKYDSVMQQISVCNGILEKNMIKELTKKK